MPTARSANWSMPSCRWQRYACLVFAVGAAMTPRIDAQATTYSDWIQATGLKKIEYRWRLNDSKGCDLEYHNLDDGDHRKYKTRILFQVNGDEHEKPYTILSFADPAPYLDSVPACTMVTDVSVTRF